MKIVIFSDVFLPKIDGVVTSLEQLILQFDRMGHEVLLIAPAARGAPKKIGKRVQLFYLPSIPAYVYPGFRLGLLSPKLNKIFKQFQPDIVQIATPANVGLMGIFLAKRYHLPIVGVFHGYFMKPEYLQIVGITKGIRYIENLGWRFTKLVFGSSQVIISPAESVKKDLMTHGFTNQLVVCPNGLTIDESKFNESLHKKLLKRLNINPKKTFLYVGRLSKEKNLFQMLKVFYLLQQKVSDAQLLIVGGGPIQKELEHAVHLYDIKEKVTFLGEVRHDDLFRLGIFKMARAFLSCSTSEVLPMSIIEAMFYGLPIIASQSQGMVDLVEHDVNGYLIKPTGLRSYVKAMEEILFNDVKWKNFAKASLKKSKFFSSEYSAECYIKVFNDVISNQSHLQNI